MSNFITLIVTIWTLAEYNYQLVHDVHQLSGAENVKQRITKFAIKVSKMHKFTKIQFP
jgi:hypothetical protein